MTLDKILAADHQDKHDRGLLFDLETARTLSRRRALGLFGLAGGALTMAGCGSSSSAAPASPQIVSTASGGTCVGYATETDGPFPADGTNRARGATSNVLTISDFQRSDIRPSLLGSSTVANGVQLDIALTLADVNNACAPLAGYAVYVWHNDAQGDYSLYDVPSESYLRGIQVCDAMGQVRFTTIFPGCYGGRYPHIHFEVFSSLANASSGNFARLISQFALPAAECEAVYADSATYGSSLSRIRSTSITRDYIFRNNAPTQMAAMTMSLTGNPSAGYAATAMVGIAT